MTHIEMSSDTLQSPIGTIVVLTDADERLRVLDFSDYETRMTLLLDRHYGRGGWTIAKAPAPSRIRVALERYFAGDTRALDDVPTATGGSVFQRRVWAALRAVPPSETISYGTLAARLGQPTASRAVGLANGQNPIAIVVPCHRIIGAGGALTGYGGGLARKRWLIDHEARHTCSSTSGSCRMRAAGRPAIATGSAKTSPDAG